MSGSGFFAASKKTINPSIRRRRRGVCDKHLNFNHEQPDIISNLDSIPATPITPPAAFLPGYKRVPGRGENAKDFIEYIKLLCQHC